MKIYDPNFSCEWGKQRDFIEKNKCKTNGGFYDSNFEPSECRRQANNSRFHELVGFFDFFLSALVCVVSTQYGWVVAVMRPNPKLP